jgi:2-polyprenyl-3-methyl-5-hydroxy-6-metoxy-1,4-benzoquinol methylase
MVGFFVVIDRVQHLCHYLRRTFKEVSMKASGRPLQETIFRGGQDGERLYLQDLDFIMSSGQKVSIRRTDIPKCNMTDLIARAKGRYGLLALFCRPGHKLLDLACGAGLAADFLKDFDIIYEGLDYDPVTIEYALRLYGNNKISFTTGNLCSLNLNEGKYDLIGAIECLEHIDERFQGPLIDACYKALKPGGVLVISSPENSTGISGPGSNPHHKWELNKEDFLTLIKNRFGDDNVDLLTYQAVLSFSSTRTTCFFGICRKPI